MSDPAAAASPPTRLAHTPWLPAGALGTPRGRAVVARFTRRTWRLPSWVPPVSATHALSARLPARGALPALLRRLAGRFVVVNYAPAAALARAESALVRGLCRAAVAGVPAGWAGAPRDGHARWPRDGRRAHEDSLAREWVADHAAGAEWAGGAEAVALALYEWVTPLHVRDGGGPPTPAGAAEGQDAGPRCVARADYALVLLAGSGEGDSSAWAAADAAVAASPTPLAPRPWFAGEVLVPDPAATDAMDPASRVRWARLTGRLEAPDAYWFPDSWARFLESGQHIGCVSAGALGSRPGRTLDASADAARYAQAAAERSAAATAFTPRIDRGIAVPPGYCQVACHGTLDVRVVPVD